MKSKRVNVSNTQKKYEAKSSFLKVLSDGKWHQAKNLKEETQISPRTLYKKIREFEPFLEIEKQIPDGERAQAYKANPTLMRMLFQIEFLKSAWLDIRDHFLETKDLSQAVKNVNTLTNTTLVLALSDIKDKAFDTANQDILETYFESFVWSTYEYLTLMLANFCAETKILNEINLEMVTKELMES